MPDAEHHTEAHALLHRCMSGPAYYPHSPASVEVIGTPCSTIYLAGDRVYKVKRAVRLRYLDFSTSEARRTACEAELALNRELAPGVYRRVIPLWRPRGPEARLDDPHLAGEAPLNYAVEMRRLPSGGMLSELLRGGVFSPSRLQALVNRLAEFHAKAGRSPAIAAMGDSQHVIAELQENASELAPFAGDIHDRPDEQGGLWTPTVARRVTDWLSKQAAEHAPLIDLRARRGRVVDGHGDLHSGNICFDPDAVDAGNPEGVVIYDRLEFRDDFRARDVAGEIACLAMTIDAAGLDEGAEGAPLRRCSAELLSEYSGRTTDPDVLTLAPMWKAHYALVRGKVHALRSLQVAGAERGVERLTAMGLLALAAGGTLGPAVALMVGLPGSGKSYIARRLAAATGASWIRADDIRKQLEGAAPTTRLSPEMYTPQTASRVYDALAARARGELDRGRPVILDATFRTPAARAPLLDLARAAGAPAVLVHCSATEATTRTRLAARTARGTDPSDADFGVYQQLREGFAPPDSAEGPVVSASEATHPLAVTARILHAWSSG